MVKSAEPSSFVRISIPACLVLFQLEVQENVEYGLTVNGHEVAVSDRLEELCILEAA